MEMIMRIYDIENKEYIEDGDTLMRVSGQDPRMGFESVAVQGDGTPIVCDQCGNFGYLDPNKYQVRYLEERKRTGRTSRMLSEAKSLAEQGRDVYVVFNDRSQANHWRNMFGEALAEKLGVKFETAHEVGLDWEIMTVRGTHPNCVFLIDHTAIEQRYKKQLEMMNKYAVSTGNLLRLLSEPVT